jgi:hypothetical protein
VITACRWRYDAAMGVVDARACNSLVCAGDRPRARVSGRSRRPDVLQHARVGGANAKSDVCVCICFGSIDLVSQALKAPDQFLDLGVGSLRRLAQQSDDLVDWPVQRMHVVIDDPRRLGPKRHPPLHPGASRREPVGPQRLKRTEAPKLSVNRRADRERKLICSRT